MNFMKILLVVLLLATSFTSFAQNNFHMKGRITLLSKSKNIQLIGPVRIIAPIAADGSFEIKDLPAGKYVVEVWHEYLGSKTQEVQVGDAIATANFTLAK